MNSPYKMYGKSPMMKALIGGQKNLAKQGAPELQAAIEASPTRMYDKKSPATKKIGKRTVEKLPEGGKRVRVTDKEGRVKKEVIKGKGYKGVTKFDKQGRETLSKQRSGKERSKTQTKYNDFSDKPSEVKVTRKKGLLGKKTVRKTKFKKDNRDFFPS